MYMSAYVPHFSSSGDVQAWDLFVLLTGLLFGFSEVASSFSVEFVTLHFSLALIYNTSTGYQNQFSTLCSTSVCSKPKIGCASSITKRLTRLTKFDFPENNIRICLSNFANLVIGFYMFGVRYPFV